MNIYLLTHERELDRETNTGRLVVDCLGGDAKRVVWERVNPNSELIDLIEKGEMALVYPKEGTEHSDVGQFENFLIIDATWQEAKKVYCKSPYLKVAKRVALDGNCRSVYRLRRNQPVGGLCTAECVIELLKAKGKDDLAGRLAVTFERFNNQAHLNSQSFCAKFGQLSA